MNKLLLNKLLILFLITGLVVTITACSGAKTSNADTTNVNTNNVNTGNVNTGSVNSGNVATDNTNNNIVAIADIKNNESLNKTFTVQGIVISSVKIGSISGYRLKDATDNIPISSKTLAEINTTQTVTGVLKHSSYFGFYLATTG